MSCYPGQPLTASEGALRWPGRPPHQQGLMDPAGAERKPSAWTGVSLLPPRCCETGPDTISPPCSSPGVASGAVRSPLWSGCTPPGWEAPSQVLLCGRRASAPAGTPPTSTRGCLLILTQDWVPMSPLKGALLAPTPALPAASPTLSPGEHLSAPAMVVRAGPCVHHPSPQRHGPRLSVHC